MAYSIVPIGAAKLPAALINIGWQNGIKTSMSGGNCWDNAVWNVFSGV
ncbi:MAG: hypothetical protein ABL924_16485 [Methyloglobulus sp.]